MTTTSINLPLYRVLKSLNVPEGEAEAAAQAGSPDLSQLATKEELRAEIAGVKAEIANLRSELKTEIGGVRGEVANVRSELKAEVAGVRAEIAQASQRQTTWLFGALVAAVGVLLAAQRLMPQTLPSDAVRAIVAQTVRDMRAQPGAVPVPPRNTPQP